MNPETTGTSSTQDVDSRPDQAATSSDPESASIQNSGAATDSMPDTEAVAQTGATPDTEPAIVAGSMQNVAPATETAERPDTERAKETGSTQQGPATSPAQRPGDDSAGAADVAGNGHPLLSADARQDFSGRWNEIQADFVDRPQGAVQDADVLVVEVMQRVTGSLSKEKERLELQWRQGDDVSTEDLRVALTRYRSFFDRLLSA
jgi:hypothetical protein